MSGPDTETLTAALRRLADEHASGLLSVATPGRDVVVELADGAPVAIGPVHDAGDRVGTDADEALVAVAVVDELVDRMVAAIVRGGGDWAWDVSSDEERLPVPAGLVEELARRAVDAAQALADIAPEDVLSPGHDVDTSGELDRVRALFDGERTLADVAVAAGLTVPAVATMAAALVGAGALATDDEPEGEPVSWSDAVRASDVDDEDDDEPELWVMEPAEDEDDEDEWLDDEDDSADEASGVDDQDEDEPVVPAASTPRFSDVGAFEETAVEADDEDAAAAPEPDEAETPLDEPAPVAAAGEWNDTTWLDELAPQDAGADAPPVLAAGEQEPADPRAALSSMLNDLQQDDTPRSAPPAEEPPAPQEAPADEKPVGTERREPKAEPGEVAEFLRELSRLALDDD